MTGLQFDALPYEEGRLQELSVCQEICNRSLAVTALTRYFRAARASKRLP